MELIPVKLKFNEKILHWGIKFVGYLILFFCLSVGTHFGFKLATLFTFPAVLKGMDKVLAVMCGGILGCLVGAVFVCGAFMLTEHLVASKEKEYN